MKSKILFLFVLIMAISKPIFATEVNWDGGTLDAQTLDGVQTINVSGTITVNGTIVINTDADVTIQGSCTFVRGTNNKDELFDVWDGATLTMKGTSETSRIILDGKNLESHTMIRNDENMVLENVTIQNNNCITYRGMVTDEEAGTTDETDTGGNSKDTLAGGAITIIHTPTGTTTLNNCIIQNCTARDGGAIYMLRNGTGTVNINNTTIKNCKATGSKGGGAIFIDGKPKTDETLASPANYVLNVTNSLIDGCIGNNGSAIFMHWKGVGEINLTNTTFQNNSSSAGSGGTIRSDGNSNYKLMIDDCLIQDNYSYSNGGGVYWNASGPDSKLVVKGNTKVLNNEAKAQGGGLFVEGRSIEIQSATIEGNKAQMGGGIGIKTFADSSVTGGNWSSTDSFNLVLSSDVTIKNNIATLKGGGLAYNIVDAVNIVSNGYTFNFTNEGAIFEGNKVSSDGTLIDGVGGAIAIIDATSTCEYNVNTNINSGTFNNNYAKDGGAIHITIGKFNMTGGKIYNHDVEGNGGAVYIANGNAIIEGGTIQNCKATNGGAIYITGGNFTMESGIIRENSASNEGGALYVNDGDITIGLEACKAEDTTHIHPILENNEAINNGGAISIVDGIIKMYCGNLVDNNAVKNQASNSVNQTGGEFNIWGGNLGIGIIVTEDSVFNDYRPVIYKVVYHAIYDDVDVSENIEIEANELLQLPSEDELENSNFKRSGYVLLGWSTNPDSAEGYIKVGETIPIPENVDLYAVWKMKTFIVYIPETFEIGKSNVGTITISAELTSFNDGESIDILVSGMDRLLLKDTDIAVEYELADSENSKKNGDIVATFSNNDIEPKDLFITVLDEDIYYSGKYSDTITFEIKTK